MKKLAAVALLLAAFCPFVHAQTIVSATVTDPSGYAYSNAALTITQNGFVVPPQLALNSAGAFSARLNAGTYTFTVNFQGVQVPVGTGPQTCVLANEAISGSTQILTFACPALTNISSSGGGLISFTTGNLTPLFNVSLGASPTIAPAQVFTAINVAQNSFLAGPSTGGTGAYSFRAIVAGDVPTLNQSTTGNAATATNATEWGGISIGSAPPGSGYCPTSTSTSAATWQACGSGGSNAFAALTPSTNTSSGFISTPTSTTVIPWQFGCPLSITVNCFVLQGNGVNTMWEDSNFHINIQTLNLPGTTTDSILYGNSSGAVGQVTPPAGPGVFTVGYAPTNSTPVAPTTFQVGVCQGGGPVTGSTATYTVAYTDVGCIVNHAQGGTASVNVTLPTATTLNDPTFGMRWCNQSTHADTITPTTWTIQVGSTAAGATAPVAAGTCILIWVDPGSSTNWLASGGVVSGGSGNTTSTSLTSNTIPKANGANSIVNSSISDNGTTVSTSEPISAGSVSTGSGCTAAGSTATGGVCMTEAASTGWTPTAGDDYIRADLTTHTLLCSQNGGAEAACGGFSITAAGSYWMAYCITCIPGGAVTTGAMSTTALEPLLWYFNLPYTAKVTVVTALISTGTASTFGDVGMYSVSGTTGTLIWHTGSESTATAGSVFGGSGGVTLGTPVTLPPGQYYISTCNTATTPQLVINGGSTDLDILMGSTNPAHTWGVDATDVCTSGTAVLPSTITTTNIANSTSVAGPPVVKLSN